MIAVNYICVQLDYRKRTTFEGDEDYNESDVGQRNWTEAYLSIREHGDCDYEIFPRI